MNDLCSGCGKPPHQGGCKLVAPQLPPLSDGELQKRQDYLQSDEFRRERDASLAGRNPATVEALPGATTALHAELAKERDRSAGLKRSKDNLSRMYGKQCRTLREARTRIAELEKRIVDHRCRLPSSIEEALNSGDGTYKP